MLTFSCLSLSKKAVNKLFLEQLNSGKHYFLAQETTSECWERMVIHNKAVPDNDKIVKWLHGMEMKLIIINITRQEKEKLTFGYVSELGIGLPEASSSLWLMRTMMLHNKPVQCLKTTETWSRCHWDFSCKVFGSVASLSRTIPLREHRGETNVISKEQDVCSPKNPH